ncbi:hypothetical protein CVT24_001814 [Panaeolus cyanescens]|uniref:Cyanovirin-N domain-containing protein n=1 Tax=Panaeolus cyanescens TaxID=181874 RepID=A0A409YFK9_9AGAR|nr:hypothetical protein CVT24_001814 [Panaeolus cyanescens]
MSFSETSTNARLDDNGVLYAECQNDEGEVNTSTLNLNDYIGVINGEFTFAKGGYVSYTAGRVVEGSILKADVTDENTGAASSQELDLDLCVANIDGVLQFENP